MTTWRVLAVASLFFFWQVGDAGLRAEGPLAGAVIVVDAGHGGQRYSQSYTGGTRGTESRLTESELNLRVAFELNDCCARMGRRCS